MDRNTQLMQRASNSKDDLPNPTLLTNNAARRHVA